MKPLNEGRLSTKIENSPIRDQCLEWLWPVLLAVTVFFASGNSEVAAPNVVGIDKIAHFFVYGLLGTLVARVSVVAHWRWLGLYWGVVICSFYGMSDEFHQSFTPGRSVELTDWVMDTSGAALAVFVYERWRWYRGFLESGLVRRSQVEMRRVSAPDSSS